MEEKQSGAAQPHPYDEVGAIIAYEQGELDWQETVELFQHLVDNGHAWTLQGHYGRQAMLLINAGQVHPHGKLPHPFNRLNEDD